MSSCCPQTPPEVPKVRNPPKATTQIHLAVTPVDLGAIESIVKNEVEKVAAEQVVTWHSLALQAKRRSSFRKDMCTCPQYRSGPDEMLANHLDILSANILLQVQPIEMVQIRHVDATQDRNHGARLA
eukprot:5184919-Amphidinium_carterae.1